MANRLTRKNPATTSTPGLQTVTDISGYTTDVITQITKPVFTYNGSGQLTNIAYIDGTAKVLAYNGDGTLHTLTITKTGFSTVVKTFNYTAGVLTSVT